MSYYRKLIGGAFPVEIFQANGTVGTNVTAVNYPSSIVGVKECVIYYKNLTTNEVREVISPTNVQSIPNNMRNYNVYYEVKAAAVIDGVQFPYLGATKTIRIPDAVPIIIQQCGQVLPAGDTISISSQPNVIDYIFRAKRVGGSGTYYYVTQPSRFVGLSSFAGMTINPASDYIVSVSWTYFDPITSSIITVPYGAECTVTSYSS